MTAPMRRPLLTQQRAEIARVQSVVADDTWVIGRIFINGIGEIFAEVPFPCRFQERPFPIMHGVELADDTPEVEHIPDVDAAVVRWKKTPNGSHYIGADIHLRVGGRSEQRLWVTYAFFGKAMSAIPTGTDSASEV